MAVTMFRLQKNFSLSSVQIIVLRQVPTRFSSSDVSHADERRFPKIKADLSSLKRGTGGRSSFSGQVVTVFGATGFLGRRVINQLGKSGAQVIIPYRSDPYNCAKLKLCGDLGQILFTHFHLKDEESIAKAMQYSNVVINLLGRDFETPNFTYHDVHVQGAKTIARLAREMGVETFLHVSNLNAEENAKPIVSKKGARYYSSKWEGEQVVREEFPEAIIFRPSDMWGQQDTFLYYYTSFVRRTWRSMALWKSGVGIIKQPVYGSDVAKGIAKAIRDPDAAGHTFQAVGPYRYELSEFMDWIHRIMLRTNDNHYYRFDIRLDPTFWARLLFAETILPRFRTLSWGRLERESKTDVFRPDLPTLEDLGVTLTPMEERIFYELKPFRLHAYHDQLSRNYVRPVTPCPLATN